MVSRNIVAAARQHRNERKHIKEIKRETKQQLLAQ